MKLTNDAVHALRKDFPIFNDPKLVFLDSAATTQKPQAVIDAVSNFYSHTNANIHRGVYSLSVQATQAYDAARDKTAKLFNAAQEEIIFTRGTTESLNALGYTLGSLDLQGKDVVITELEHHSNMIPWQQFCKRHKMNLKYIAVKEDCTLDYDDAAQKITDDTAVLAVNHISNSLGTINDIKKLVTLGKKAGAYTVVDAAQSAGHAHIDVKELGCDFLACSSHKMLGPTGVGVLYGRKELLEKMDPFHFGGDMIRMVTFKDATWNTLPMKFEGGTPNIAGVTGFGAALDYLQNISLKSIAAWENELLKYALDQMEALGGVDVHNAGVGKSAGIISFNLTDAHCHDSASLLNDHGVCVRAGHHCTMPLMDKLGFAGTARASFYVYNTMEDVDALIAALKKVQDVFK